jgi:hypothetical protein
MALWVGFSIALWLLWLMWFIRFVPKFLGRRYFAEGSGQALLELHLVRELSGALPEASSPGLCGHHT